MSMQLINMGVRWQKSGPEPFSMTINTELAGSASDTFILPLYLIDTVKVAWGDGTFSTHTTGGNVTHIYPASGIYNIKITGEADQVIRFNNVGDKAKLLSVDSFGDFEFLTAGDMFYGCTSLTTLDVSSWDTSKVTNFSFFAYNCTSLTALDVSNWDTSNVINFGYFACNCTSLITLDVSGWDVSKATNFNSFVRDCTSLTTLDASNWNVSNVTKMDSMFRGATSFNGDVSGWDVSNVTDMSYMFREATSFNQDLSQWCVRNILTQPTYFALYSALAPANYPVWGTCPRNEDGLSTPFIITVKTDNAGTSADNEFYLPIYGSDFTVKTSDGQTIENNNAPILITFPAAGTYDIEVSGVYERFQFSVNNPSKLIDVKQWGTNKWTSMFCGFLRCDNLTGFSATDKPDLSNVLNMDNMFNGTNSFNGDISNWDVSNVTDMSSMFSGATSFNGDISGWNVGNVTTMNSMFRSASSFNQDISSWDVSNVTNMSNMFYGATSFNQDLTQWCVRNILTEPIYFALNSALAPANYPVWGTCPRNEDGLN